MISNKTLSWCAQESAWYERVFFIFAIAAGLGMAVGVNYLSGIWTGGADAFTSTSLLIVFLVTIAGLVGFFVGVAGVTRTFSPGHEGMPHWVGIAMYIGVISFSLLIGLVAHELVDRGNMLTQESLCCR